VRLRTTITLVLALAAGLAAGCGSDEEGKQLPPQAAADLQRQLNSIQARFDVPGGAACRDVTDGDDPNTTQVDRIVDSLPDDVDPDLRNAVRDSFDHLFELVEQACQREQEQTETETTETEPTTPTTETTETEPTTPTTDTTDTAPPDTGTDQGVPPGQDGEPPGQGGQSPGQSSGGGGTGAEDKGG
jgi:hypothetical protein